jgi:hypothetical protein
VRHWNGNWPSFAPGAARASITTYGVSLGDRSCMRPRDAVRCPGMPAWVPVMGQLSSKASCASGNTWHTCTMAAHDSEPDTCKPGERVQGDCGRLLAARTALLTTPTRYGLGPCIYITVSKLAAVGGPQVDTCKNRPDPAGSAANAAADRTHIHAAPNE